MGTDFSLDFDGEYGEEDGGYEDFSLDINADDFSDDSDYYSEEEEESDVFVGYTADDYSDSEEEEEEDTHDSNEGFSLDFSLDLEDEDEEDEDEEGGGKFLSLPDVDIEDTSDNESIEGIEDNDDNVHKEDGTEAVDVSVDDYQETLVNEPESKDKLRKRRDYSQTSLGKPIYNKLLLFNTVHGVDMTNPRDRRGTPLENSHVNSATGKKSYKRKNGVLSRKEMDFFASFSQVELSNARYPGEYLNVARSNEEVMDSAQQAHRRAVRSFLNRGIDPEKSTQKTRKKVRLSPGEEAALSVLARLKFASTTQISRALGRSYQNTSTLMWHLKQRGFVRSPDSPYHSQKTWCVSTLGMDMSGYDLVPPNISDMSMALIQHTTVVNNMAAFIYAGSVNVLDEPNFPQKNRIDNRGNVVFGNEFVSETQIRSSFGKLLDIGKSGKGDKYVPLIQGKIDDEFERWERRKAKDPYLASPERRYGNEYMWVLFPPPSVGIYQHIPDLVIPKERNADGSPNSIAVEVELKTKQLENYRKTLVSYDQDDRFFKEVVWICSRKKTANLLIRAAKKYTKLLEKKKIKILPIETEEGIFRGQNVIALG